VRDQNPDRHRGFSHRQQPPGPEACGVPALTMAFAFRRVPSVADAGPAPTVPSVADVGASFVGPVQPPEPLY